MPLTAVAAHPKKQNIIRVTNAVIPTKKRAAFFLFPLYSFAAKRLSAKAVKPAIANRTKHFMSISGFSVKFGILGGIIG